jgi:hypothetical protein
MGNDLIKICETCKAETERSIDNYIEQLLEKDKTIADLQTKLQGYDRLLDTVGQIAAICRSKLDVLPSYLRTLILTYDHLINSGED